MRKKIAALALVACMGFYSAMAETGCANTEYGSFLFTDECTIVWPEREYSEIRELGGECFAAKDAEGWHILNAEGAEVSNVYSELQPCGNAIMCRYNSMWGLLDREMHVLYDCVYSCIVSNGEGGFLATKTNTADSRADGVYRLDGDGGEEASGTLTLYGLNEFSEGLAPACGSENGKMGYLNAKGEWAITPQFLYAEAFLEDGCAAVAVDAGAGLIDKEGNYELTPKYRLILHSSGNRLTAAISGSECAVYDTKEHRVVFEEEADYAQTRYLNDLVILNRDETGWLVGTDGEIRAELPHEMKATIVSGGEWLICYMDGETQLIEPENRETLQICEQILPLDSGLYAFLRDRKCSIGTGEGDPLYEFECDGVERLNGHFLLLHTENNELLVNTANGQSTAVSRPE